MCGPPVSAVSRRCPRPVTAFPHGSIGQVYGMKMVFVALDTGDIHLDFDDASINAINGGAEGSVEHRQGRWPAILARESSQPL